MEIKTLTEDIVRWADGVFPDRQPTSALLKLFEEVGELVRNPNSPGEYADICIMLFDLAHMHGIDLAEAITNKMEVNKSRDWILTKTGTMQHFDESQHMACPKRQAYLQGVRDAREGNHCYPEDIWSPTLVEWYIRGYHMAAGEGDV